MREGACRTRNAEIGFPPVPSYVPSTAGSSGEKKEIRPHGLHQGHRPRVVIIQVFRRSPGRPLRLSNETGREFLSTGCKFQHAKRCCLICFPPSACKHSILFPQHTISSPTVVRREAFAGLQHKLITASPHTRVILWCFLKGLELRLSSWLLALNASPSTSRIRENHTLCRWLAGGLTHHLSFTNRQFTSTALPPTHGRPVEGARRTAKQHNHDGGNTPSSLVLD